MRPQRRPLSCSIPRLAAALAPALSMLLVSALFLSSPLIAGNADAARRAGQSAQTAQKTEPTYLAGTIILKLRSSVANSRDGLSFGVPELDQAMRTLGAVGRRPLFPLATYSPNTQFAISAGNDGGNANGFERTYVVRYNGPYDAQWGADLVTKSGAVEFAEPYYTFNLAYSVNDPLAVGQLWLDMVHAPEAWDIAKGDSTALIGICDTGVDWRHEDLSENIFNNPGESGKDSQGRDKSTNGIDDDGNGKVDDIHGWDLIGNPGLPALSSGQYQPDNDPAPHYVAVSGYEGYHGTAVAGCASARADNGIGIAGTGFHSKLLPVKCTDDSLATGQVIAGYDGIVYAADMGARVINCSWGGPGNLASSQALQSVIDYAYNKGGLVVAASGNLGTDNDYTPNVPANLRHVLSVGATTNLDSAAGFAQYGVSVGVWAPGVGTLTTLPGQQYNTTYNGAAISGTSFSSPIVAGIAALVFGKHPTWTPDQVAMQLRVTGDRVKVSTPQLGPYFFRRVNALSAVSINQDLASGSSTNLPGIGIVSFTINGKAVDTITSVDQIASLEVTLKNYLAPTRNLKIEAFENQALTTIAPVSVPVLGTLETTTKTLQVHMNPAAPTLYSEANLQLVLHMTDGAYEDFATVMIPIRLPGWHQQVDPTQSSLAAYVGGGVKAVTPTVGWAVSNIQNSQTSTTTVYSRTTNGNSWFGFQQLSTGTEPVYCVTGLDDKHAWAGSGPTSKLAGVFRTTNGGGTWQRSAVTSITPFVDAVHFFDDANGIFIGDPVNGKWGIGTTSDGGITWKQLATPVVPLSGSEAGWNNSFAAYGDNLWFGTNSSRIYHSTDRGQSWTSAPTPTVNSFGIAFANPNDGLSIFSPGSGLGGSSMVASSSDGGDSWQTATLPFQNAQPECVMFVPGTTRAFVGTQNGVYETSDFGKTWKPMAMPIMNFSGIYLSGAVDTSGSFAAYGTNVYSQLMTYKEQLPKPTASVPVSVADNASVATLYQNMPNPFAASTTIAFDLHRPAQVDLSLWNSSGARVMTIASGAMSAGGHSVTLEGAGLPSGSYFYLLTANGETHTGQLVVTR